MTCCWHGLGLMWTCLRGCWHGVMTSSDDVRMTSVAGCWRERCVRVVHWRAKESLGKPSAHGGTCNTRWPPYFSGLQISRQWGWHGGACGYNLTWVSRFLVVCGEVPELLAMHGGAWGCRWGPSFWVFVVGGRGARLWC